MTLRYKMVLGGIAAVIISFLIAGIFTYIQLSPVNAILKFLLLSGRLFLFMIIIGIILLSNKISNSVQKQWIFSDRLHAI